MSDNEVAMKLGEVSGKIDTLSVLMNQQNTRTEKIEVRVSALEQRMASVIAVATTIATIISTAAGAAFKYIMGN